MFVQSSFATKTDINYVHAVKGFELTGIWDQLYLKKSVWNCFQWLWAFMSITTIFTITVSIEDVCFYYICIYFFPSNFMITISCTNDPSFIPFGVGYLFVCFRDKPFFYPENYVFIF